MVDNINMNKITPLLSSAERVKRVDRKNRDDQKPPFKGALKEEQKKKKKKKKKKDETEIPSETRNARASSRRRARAVKGDQKRENSLEPVKDKKIIDIRV